MNNHYEHVHPSKKIGLVLGGGGAKGLAHIGALKVLCAANIPIAYISGCSMGGLIGSLFAYGIPIEEIETNARKFTSVREMIKLIDRTPSRKGLMVGKKVRSYLSQFISPTARLEETQIPMILNAVDLISGTEIELREGLLLDCIMASAAVPGFFPPVEMGSYRLIDGGTLDDVPVRLLKYKPVDLILAVDVHANDHGTINTEENHHGFHLALLPLEFVSDFYRAAMIMTSALIKINLEVCPPDILISPVIPRDVSLFRGFQKADQIIDAGELAMKNALPDLIERMNN
jgi:NTE family protein